MRRKVLIRLKKTCGRAALLTETPAESAASSPAAVACRSPTMNQPRNPCRIRHRRWHGRARPDRRAIPWPAGCRRHAGRQWEPCRAERIHRAMNFRGQPATAPFARSDRHGSLKSGRRSTGIGVQPLEKTTPTPWREASGGIGASARPAPRPRRQVAPRDTRRASRRIASMREPVVGPAAAPVNRLARQRWSNPPPLPIGQGSPAQGRPGFRS